MSPFTLSEFTLFICLDIDNIDFAFFYTIDYILNMDGSSTAQIIQHNYWIMIAHAAHTSKVEESLRCIDKIVIIILVSCYGSNHSDSIPSWLHKSAVNHNCILSLLVMSLLFFWGGGGGEKIPFTCEILALLTETDILAFEFTEFKDNRANSLRI